MRTVFPLKLWCASSQFITATYKLSSQNNQEKRHCIQILKWVIWRDFMFSFVFGVLQAVHAHKILKVAKIKVSNPKLYPLTNLTHPHHPKMPHSNSPHIHRQLDRTLFYSNMTVSLCIRQGSKRNDDWVSVEELDWSAESQVLIPAKHLWCDFKCRPWAKNHQE